MYKNFTSKQTVKKTHLPCLLMAARMKIPQPPLSSYDQRAGKHTRSGDQGIWYLCYPSYIYKNVPERFLEKAFSVDGQRLEAERRPAESSTSDFLTSFGTLCVHFLHLL